MRGPHLAVVGGGDQERVVEHAPGLERVEDLDQVGVRGLHQVAVEVQVVALLPLRPDRAGEVEDATELPLHPGLRREILVGGRRRLDLPREPRLVITRVVVGRRVHEDVVRIDQRDDEEEGLLVRGGRAQVIERPLGTRHRGPLGVHEAAVVVGDPAGLLGDVLVGAGIRWVPALEPVLVDVGGHPGVAVGRLDAVKLALVDGRVAGGARDRRRVREVGRELDLRVLPRRHVRLERVLDAVLGGEVAAEQRRARRRAHAGVREGTVEGQAVALQLGEPRHVAPRPPRREVLNRPLLIGDEEDHVHARRLGRGLTPAGPLRRPGARAADQEAGRRRGGALEQVAAGDAALRPFVGAHWLSPLRLKATTALLLKAVP